MGGMICRQPNGLLCRHSTITDCITDYNMTEQDYIDLCVERALYWARKDIEEDNHRYINSGTTEEEYLKQCAYNAKIEAEEVLKSYIQSFEMIKKLYLPNNMPEEEFAEILEIMQHPVGEGECKP
ncbi:hypothetical protein LKD70_17470 [Ruminococcus sp. CLA-AA-H200]|uniref:Uncharacterized protein n=1 Tax=Ruminococcus turbiniformis TaxID=2881258 RepID=A0ABS8G2V8_9FIRM|nr:hypothetical protein [Ruminococcus turbiniformis]MCC2256174.1 hypothetical protein [Ruminococcus turbiniformis]